MSAAGVVVRNAGEVVQAGLQHDCLGADCYVSDVVDPYVLRFRITVRHARDGFVSLARIPRHNAHVHWTNWNSDK